MRSILTSITATIAIALGLAAPASAQNQALMLNGIGGGADLPDMVMTQVLGGMFNSYERRNVPWPQQAKPVMGTRYTLAESINIGASNLDAAITQALAKLGPGEHVSVVGLSAGALVVDEQLRRLAARANTVDKSKLDFFVVADSSRSSFNRNRYDPLVRYTYSSPVQSKYDTTSVVAMYDGFADFPDRVNNLTAVANAIAGEFLFHVPSMQTNLAKAPAKSKTVTVNSLGGVTTSYLIPPARLPLVQLNPWLAPQEAKLKATVDSAYIRNDKPAGAKPGSTVRPTATVPAALSTPEPPAISDDGPGNATPTTRAAGHRGAAKAARGPAPKPAATTHGRR